MFFVVILLSLVGTTLTSSLSKRGGGHHAPLINCPTCEHHVCNINNLMQCEVCQIYIPRNDLPPKIVRCFPAGQCHEDNHHHCCDNEGCLAHYFGQLTSGAVIQPVSSMECPRCLGGSCDFINRDQCFACKIELRDGQLPYVHCLKETELCDPNHHNTFCCSDEPCIAHVFGHYYPTSHGTITTTESAPSTIPIDSSATATTTQPDSSNLFLTTNPRTSNAGPQTNLTSTGYIPCPVCSHHLCDLTNTNLCEACNIAFDLYQQPHDTNCLTVEHCRDDNGHICCTDMACVENVFGNITKSGASSNGNNIYCPDCSKHGCNYISCETCVYLSYISHETQLHPFKTCEYKGECSHSNTICCHDNHCIDKLFGTHFETTLPSTQSTTIPSFTSKTTVQASTTKPHISSHATTSQPTHHVSGDATSTYRTSTRRQHSTAPPTTASSTNGTNNSCVDELNNCAMFISMGVCQASPQEGTKYDIAFQCKRTCDRCNELYQPLTTLASTIANSTSTDGHTPDQTNQLNYIPCPVCTHNICDRSNTILCEVCQITFNHQPQPQNAKCVNRGQCFEDDSNLCCTDLACVEIILGHLVSDAVKHNPLIQPEVMHQSREHQRKVTSGTSFGKREKRRIKRYQEIQETEK